MAPEAYNEFERKVIDDECECKLIKCDKGEFTSVIILKTVIQV